MCRHSLFGQESAQAVNQIVILVKKNSVVLYNKPFNNADALQQQALAGEYTPKFVYIFGSTKNFFFSEIGKICCRCGRGGEQEAHIRKRYNQKNCVLRAPLCIVSKLSYDVQYITLKQRNQEFPYKIKNGSKSAVCNQKLRWSQSDFGITRRVTTADVGMMMLLFFLYILVKKIYIHKLSKIAML